ncbi:MAG: protein-glutamate O-methyltransferase CheR [Pseudomonadota bacterium]
MIVDSDFQRFKEFFYKKTGIQFADSKRYFVDKRIIDRINHLGMKSFSEYFSRLRLDQSGIELQRIVNAMTVNETYFFREPHQFDVLVSDVLDEICSAKKSDENLRIWSIPCSTGEEAYSIALYLSEYWSGLEQWDVEVIASDIDSDVLERARQGRFGSRSLKDVPTDVIAKYFRSLPDGTFEIQKCLQNAIQFNKVNITDPDEMIRVSGVDVIFCRNLLIYFDDASRREAVRRLYEALNSGGYVFLGHSESMSRISSDFETVRVNDVTAYRKPKGEKRHG